MSKKNAAANLDADVVERLDRKRLVDLVDVKCEAFLGSGQITIGELDALSKGDTILLDCSPSDFAEIRINGTPIARGEIVTVDDRFAVRITEIG